MLRYLMILVSCCVSAGLFAQTSGQWEITGKVTDETTGEPVEFAYAVLYSAQDSTPQAQTAVQHDGSYSLTAAKAGKYYIEISFMGYKTLRLPTLTLSKGNNKVNLGESKLYPSGLALEEVDVVGRKRQMQYKLDKKVIEAEGNIAALGGTAIDILAQTPSIQVDADGEVSFRGSSGFKVYIDGKPSTMTGSTALEQIPAEHIASIEIITTPSARNEADGIAGIINIVTKKQTLNGWSGLVNLKGSTMGNRGVDFFTSYRKKNITWQTSGQAARRYRISDYDQFKEIKEDTSTTNHSYGERKSYTDTYFLRTGLDWDKGATTWTAAVEGRWGVRNRGGKLNYEDRYIYPSGLDTLEIHHGSDNVELYEWTARGDVGFNHRFAQKGHTLKGNFFAFYEGNAMEFFSTDLFNNDGTRAEGHRAEEYEYRLTAQGTLDYVKPIGDNDGKFEAGYYYYSYTEDGDYNIWMYNPDYQGVTKFGQGFEKRNDLYADYMFRRDIHALYAMMSNTYGAFSFQVGLRGEYRYRKLHSEIAKKANHVWNDFDLFPSVHTGLALKHGGNLHLSYSRRVTQPQLFYMEPYVVYVDYYTAQCGNPWIKPEYTNSFEFSYSKGMGDNAVSASLFHRRRNDKIERLRVPYHTGVTLDSMANVGSDYSTGLELSTSLQLKKWWSLDINGSLFDYRIDNDYKVNGDTKSMNWQLSASNNFDFAKATRIRLEGYYVGPSVSTQGRVNDFYYFNLSLRQQFLDRKLTAALNFRNIFATARFVRSQESAYIYSHSDISPRWPQISLSLSYTFNNFKAKNGDETPNHDLFEGTNR